MRNIVPVNGKGKWLKIRSETRLLVVTVAVMVILLLTACSMPIFNEITAATSLTATSSATATATVTSAATSALSGTVLPSVTPPFDPSPASSVQPSVTQAPAATAPAASTSGSEPVVSITPVPSVAAEPKPTATSSLKGRVVVLDPGHQTKADPELEPIAPGSEKLKPRTSSGTRGVATKRYEYEINLEIALKLKSRLEAQGCIVYMTRTENDVRISNIERAQYAVSLQPDLFLRLHCDGSSNPDVRGIRIFVPVTGPYSDQLPKWGDQLGSEISRATGAPFRGTKANAEYTGLNWADSVPSFLLEMGYMSNPEEDVLLCDPVYQHRISAGIVDFIAGMPPRR